MNHRDNEADTNPSPDEQRQLDLLVDGELDEAQRRRLLASFDARPDGWRRCALAFLEAQCFALESRAPAQPGPSPASSRRPAPNIEFDMANRSIISLSQRPRHFPSQLLAMAATFLLAFGLGFLIRQPIGRSAPDEGEPAHTFTALADAGPPVEKNLVDTARPAEHWDTVTLVMDGGARGKREVQLPVVESTADDDAWLDRRDPVVPAELRDALERLGHEVEERRQFLPLNLEDGRQVIVPVDEVEFRPVSHVYQ